MKKLLLVTTALLGMTISSHAAVITDLGNNPTSSAGAFSNDPVPGAFADQYTFQLTNFSNFLTIASATNVFPGPGDFITNFNGSVFQQIGAVGGGDDILVLGPEFATANCGLDCQGFGGVAILPAGNYYLNIAGIAGETSGYGGNIAVAGIGAVPEPTTWAMMILGFLGIGLIGMRKARNNSNFRLV
jgi:hypothetical protein